MSSVNLSIDGAVGVVSMAKPPHNLLDDVFINEIIEAYRRAVESNCRAILLRSEMRHFCAGAEVRAFHDGSASIQHSESAMNEFLDVMENTPVPTIAAVHGGALGGGLELALTCDMVIAADTAYMGQVEVAAGVLPLLGGTQRLVQRAGVVRAKEIAMVGRRFRAEIFERWGIINHVVPETDLAQAAMSLARQLASGPTLVLRGIKRQANAAAREGIAAADRIQVEINRDIWATKDRTRGIEAFLTTGPGTGIFEGD
ncbi:enoyl-CoA hydratase/isomerase family protein [Cupriavidus basilensis]|uniref:Enoyl-CoA hydratase/isomerase family protein n=1 Tax=Cupriavidus basilensis TaxID=68895 RepID=A0A643FZL1_9BURK|nr:enoyl-CoA hydratase/isomerase family protein [Cupriavidus basilensis]QOT82005.1 enoyl-CoA hydratase/isomerase family protein [Cupriavidus basilensis]